MTIHPVDTHRNFISDWERQTADGLTPLEHLHLLERAIHAIEARSSKTISVITQKVILDRVLHQGIEYYPFLEAVTIDGSIFNFRALTSQKNHPTHEIIEALRFLLVELLTVLGRITADILTGPLHREILGISSTVPEKK
jgi:hypothetical protein